MRLDFVREGRSAWLLWGALVLGGTVQGELDNETSPTSQFRSRPDLHPPILNLTILRPDLVTPGYNFIAPYRNLDPGPYIYDNYGDLVWSGAGSSGPKTAHAPRPCEYKGETHMCYFQGEQHQGFARGHGVIMDKHYRIVKTVESSGAGASSDMHEFKMTPFARGSSALLTVYQPRQYDLTTNPMFNVERGMGWVVEGVFQEVELDTGRVLFEWRSLDHVDPSESVVMPSSTDTSGDGLDEQTPWDYFHLNSIDKNEEGDYLLSARHVSSIYKISGQDGHILWQLGGLNPTFQETNFNFSYQHHARWISENDTHTLLSFFDNASNTFNSSNEFSHGYIVSINHVNSTATKLKSWDAPEDEGGLLSGSQGNLQLLPNGNAHIGWGEHAYFSEHTSDGACVLYAKVATRESNVMIYRSGKYNWTGIPQTKPALWSYAREREADDGMRLWASWNGATEVKTWKFYGGQTSKGTWWEIGNATRAGFETEFFSSVMWPWVFAEALDVHDLVLERSVFAKTFIPSPSLLPFCDEVGCAAAEKTDEEHTMPFEAGFKTEQVYQSTSRGFDTSKYYQDSPRPRERHTAVFTIAWIVLSAVFLSSAAWGGWKLCWARPRHRERDVRLGAGKEAAAASSSWPSARKSGLGSTVRSSLKSKFEDWTAGLGERGRVLGRYMRVGEREMEGSWSEESNGSRSGSARGS